MKFELPWCIWDSTNKKNPGRSCHGHFCLFYIPYWGIGFTHTGRYNPKMKQVYKWINNFQLQRIAFMMQQSLVTVHLPMTKQTSDKNTNWPVLKVLSPDIVNLSGTFPWEKWCQPRRQIQLKETELEGLLRVNLASKMAAKLLFQSNSEFIAFCGSKIRSTQSCPINKIAKLLLC